MQGRQQWYPQREAASHHTTLFSHTYLHSLSHAHGRPLFSLTQPIHTHTSPIQTSFLTHIDTTPLLFVCSTHRPLLFIFKKVLKYFYLSPMWCQRGGVIFRPKMHTHPWCRKRQVLRRQLYIPSKTQLSSQFLRPRVFLSPFLRQGTGVWGTQPFLCDSSFFLPQGTACLWKS